ncbi:helix-turn-helix transcriptional regulator [Neptuniibacter halophilus]|uniref:helix-turn-helix transcriptional regulator n=1 Tax=Neptuniibacter halophilus TaxID=651666 RepID=UPI002573FD5E|nr:AraC family transcriptional regulator [Neptuniibacter halophilus]
MHQDPTHFLTRSEALPFVELRAANRSAACYHTHSHDEFSFGVIDTGSADYRNQQQVHRIQRGTTVTINPGDAHSCNPDAGAWSYRMLFVDTAWVGELQNEFFKTGGSDYLPFPTLYNQDSQSFAGFNQLYPLLLQAEEKLAAETALINFLHARFARGYCARRPDEKLDNFHIQRVRSLIMDQLESNWSLDDFSAESGLSRYHLIRSFKDHYGQTPHAYQLDQRIKKARTLLQSGETLANTAQLLGFADQSHFQRNFKKRVAITPKQYQSFFQG